MSAATALTPTPAAIIERALVSKSQLKRSWEEYHRDAEPKGIAFGKLCYEFRASSEVVQGGTSFRATLAELGIPKSTAYYWMERYEMLIGVPTVSVTEAKVESVPAGWSPKKPARSATLDVTPQVLDLKSVEELEALRLSLKNSALAVRKELDTRLGKKSFIPKVRPYVWYEELDGCLEQARECLNMRGETGEVPVHISRRIGANLDEIKKLWGRR